MNELNYNEKKKYFNFLNNLAKKLTRVYFKKLQGSFKVDNKLKKKENMILLQISIELLKNLSEKK